MSMYANLARAMGGYGGSPVAAGNRQSGYGSLPANLTPRRPGRMSQLANAMRIQQRSPWLGRAIGAASGIPGASTVGAQLGSYLGNRNMSDLNANHYFQSPAQNANPATSELMSNVDPDFAARQNSSQGFVAHSGQGGGRGMYGGVGGSMGYRSMNTGGFGSGRGGGWRTVYQRPDDGS